jgi:hypothetical protein
LKASAAAAEYSPSSGLPSPRAEHIVDQDDVTELPDGFPDELVPVANLAPRPWDVCRLETAASDAWDAALPDAILDAPQEHSDAGAEKWVDPALDVPAQVAQVHLLELLAARRARVLCKPVAAPSAA